MTAPFVDSSALPTAAAPLDLAIIGAGPVGLALALLAAQRLPQARIAVYDSQADDERVARDARTIALSLGTVQTLQRLGVWIDMAAQAASITQVHVSQQQPALLELLRPSAQGAEPQVRIRASELGVERLGAVLPYGAITAPLRQAWRAACMAQPQRLTARLGVPVEGVRTVTRGAGPAVELDAGVVEAHDVAVIAEGGVFAEQVRKALHHDYHQTAWVGQVTLSGGAAEGVAFERFTVHGPAALLPLPRREGLPAGQREAALVWCVAEHDDPVRDLTDAQRCTVLAALFPGEVGQWVSISPLKAFSLGLNAERTLVQGRTVRIGNAAQTLHPVAGQGLNLGLRDVHELVERLAREADVDTALRRMEWRRAPDRWTTLLATDFLARSFTWQWPGLSTVRGAGLALLERLPPLKARLAHHMMFGAR